MNKRKLQDFASWAKLNLEKQIELSLKKIGINSESDIKRSRVQGDITVIDGIETSFKKGFQSQREEIINKIKSDGYDHSIEQFASTWFNRIIALRFMEVHEYFDHGFKLFPSEPNTIPEILTKLSLVSDELKLDMNYCNQLQASGNNHEELYRYVLFQQCNALAKPLPMLFSSGMNHLEYFIPTPLLFGDTLINRLIEIDEDDFKEDVEITGWLYQFYVANKKDEVFASKKTITKDTLPAVTQLFTPNWIVKYMAENSLGRLWLESYPNSNLKPMMKYYVEEAEQSESVIKQLENIKYKDVNVEEIKIIEPCSGSGHILTYLFDLLFQMYLEKGYTRKDIPGLIIKNNIYGLDIDQRATQLASFALAMKARSIDNKFFDSDRYVRPKVYEIIDSKPILYSNYNGKSYLELLKDYNDNQWKGENHLSDEELNAIKYVVELFVDAKVVGSLLKVRSYKYLPIRKKLAENLRKNTQTDIFTSGFFDYEFKVLLEILRSAYVLSSSYDVIITNPPYLSLSSIEKEPKEYLSKNYPNSKTDMFTMFMEGLILKPKGLVSVINLQSWMFLQSYEKFRDDNITKNTFINHLHMGRGIFGVDFGSTSFIYRRIKIEGYITKYYRLHHRLFQYIDFKDIERIFLETLNNEFYRCDFDDYDKNGIIRPIYHNGEKILYKKAIDDFKNIPGNVFGYWASKNLLNAYAEGRLLKKLATPRTGMMTGKNDQFIRYWWEINVHKFNKNAINTKDAADSKKKWFPYNKGGNYRRWYGNNEFVIDYENSGMNIFGNANIEGRVVQDYPDKYKFIPLISWSKISSGKPSFRYKSNCLSDIAGAMLCTDNELYYYLGYLNSIVPEKILSIMSPTLNFESGQIGNLPVPIPDSNFVTEKVEENIDITKTDWDSFETSWDFSKHQLLKGNSLKDNASRCLQNEEHLFNKLKNNEQLLNEHFIKVFGMEDELDSSVSNEYISFSVLEEVTRVKSFISYLIGVLMGRYSLAEDGLIFAGGEFDFSRYGNYDIDQDGVIPIFSDLSFENGLVHRITKLINEIFGKEHYRGNIDYIAKTLGKKNHETSEETLNRHINNDFYLEHIKTYQKRPIYWMFSSGKKNGFKALIYMHRYNSNTLAKMNASYFQPATTVLRTKISEIEKQITSANEKDKVQLERLRFSLVEQLNEAIEYGQVLDYMANKYISIDLDDGVKVNYAKFQGIEISTSNGKVKKDLLIPVK